MKKQVMTVLSLVTLVLATQALARPPYGAPPMERLSETLQLEENQTAQVEQILREQHDKRHELRMEQREQTRTQMQTLHAETIDRLRPVLRPEQLQKFIELTEAHRAKRWSRNIEDARQPSVR